MMDRKYLILSACVLLSLLMVAAPVAAAKNYAVSVSSYGSGPLSSSLSPAKLAVLQGYGSTGTVNPVSAYSGVSPQKLTAVSGARTGGTTAAQGSVSAFGSFSSRTNSSSLSYKESVSVSGEIFSFEFITSFS
jgi:hypothetical protein